MTPQKILADRFGLPYSGDMQDWELEVADPARIPDFLREFDVLPGDTMDCWAELLMASFDDAVNLGTFSSTDWERYAELLSRDRERYRGLLEYWSQGGVKPDDHFAVKPFIDRDLLK